MENPVTSLYAAFHSPICKTDFLKIKFNSSISKYAVYIPKSEYNFDNVLKIAETLNGYQWIISDDDNHYYLDILNPDLDLE